MKANYDREKTAWKALPKRLRETIAQYIFVSAIKSNLAVILFRCEKNHHWKKEQMRDFFFEIVGLYQLTFFGKSISDNDLIERYEKMLDIDFSVLDTAVSVNTD